jgi:hypothetical protein
LVDWTSSWILKAGANPLVTVETHNDDGTFTYHLEQNFPQHGDRVLHEQTIDVGIYSMEGELIKVVEDVQITQEEGERIKVYEG